MQIKRKKSMKFKLIALTQIGLHRKSDGKIWIHQNEVLKSIIQEGKKPIEGFPKRKFPKKIPTCSPDIFVETATQQIIHIMLEKATQLRKKKEISFNKEELDEFQWSQEMYDFLSEKEKNLMAETDLEVLMYELHELRKREILHRRWTKDVYDPLKKNLGRAINKLPWTSVEVMRHQLHKLYLQYVNTKGHAFLDNLNPKEYPKYAFSYGVPSKMKTKIGPDPLLYQEKQRFEEDRVILRCETGMKYNDSDLEQIKQNSLPLAPLGRHGTNSNKWLQIPLVNIESTPRVASRRRMWAGRYNSGVISDILQDPHPKTEYFPDRRSISQPTYASTYVQTNKEYFPNTQQCFSKTHFMPEVILPKTSSF